MPTVNRPSVSRQTTGDAPAAKSSAAGLGQSAAFSIGVARNVLIQVAGVVMVAVMGLTAAGWIYVAAWASLTIAILYAEQRILRIVLAAGPNVALAEKWAARLRVLATSAYALAALVLIARGTAGAKLFAFALMCASMVNVLMRYYRQPRVLAACIAPYVLVICLVTWGLTLSALRAHEWLIALASTFTLALLALQFWSARGQLSVSWGELMAAREQAEARALAADGANRAKSQFLANMSHELRTPLNGVLGMAQALTDDRLTEVQKERVAIIRRSSESLLAVLNDLLDLSKIEAEALEIVETRFDLEELTRGVVALYRAQAERKGLSFACQVSEGARGAYVGDSARIRRVLYSLVDNAVKFTDAGRVTLRVEREGSRTVFRVIDTGIGIRKDDLARLFDGFFQADASLTRRHAGAGVGLAIAAELARLMGGQVEATSEPGAGSSFSLVLPLRRAAEVDIGSIDTEDRAAALRVLAAEDNAVNQLVLKTLLAPIGVEPRVVANGAEALTAWEGERWDIVLMDIQMPEMNGIDATRAIRRREAETGRERTPIVAVTANAMSHQVEEYHAAGMDAVVAKPLDVTVLYRAMEEALAA